LRAKLSRSSTGWLRGNAPLPWERAPDQVWGRLCARSAFASSFAGRPASTEALARTDVQHSCSTGVLQGFCGSAPCARSCRGRPQGGSEATHRFRGSAPQIKSGAGSAREALSPVRSPAGRLPQKHWLALTCNTVAPQGCFKAFVGARLAREAVAVAHRVLRGNTPLSWMRAGALPHQAVQLLLASFVD
jgi:hypothetical protein